MADAKGVGSVNVQVVLPAATVAVPTFTLARKMSTVSPACKARLSVPDKIGVVSSVLPPEVTAGKVTGVAPVVVVYAKSSMAQAFKPAVVMVNDRA